MRHPVGLLDTNAPIPSDFEGIDGVTVVPVHASRARSAAPG